MKLSLILLFILSISFSQYKSISIPDKLNTLTLHNSLNGKDAVIGSGGDGQDTTNTFTIEGTWGGWIIFVQGDTAGVCDTYTNASDSCLSIYLEIYDPIHKLWGTYINTTGLIDTVSRNDINKNGGGTLKYLNFATEDAFVAGKLGRLILQIGTGDSLKLLMTAKPY